MISRRLSLIGSSSEHFEAAGIDQFLTRRALIILAEPGMGKTVLLRSLETAERRYFRARRFLAQENSPSVGTILIDGLDEARAGDRHGSTLERILGKLESFGLPQFVMTCRSGDWFGEADKSRIVENIGYDDLAILQLAPLSRNDAIAVASAFTKAPENLVDEAERRGLGELLLNPELIRLLSDAIKAGWPASKSDLFRQAISVQAAESNDIHNLSDGDITTEEIIEAAGAICATYLIADCLGMARSDLADEEILDVRTVPTSPRPASVALGRRLFSTIDHNVFAPTHRTTAEYLAGRWIATKVENGVPAQRVKSMITGHDGGTLASLRGLYSWMCCLADPQAAIRLVKTDPLGVVMQGDPTLLSDAVLVVVIDALNDRARNTDPWILAEYRADEPWGTLSRPSMWPRFKIDLVDPTAPPHYKAALLNALTHGRDAPSGFTEVLVAVALDSTEPYLVRTGAVEALAKCTDVTDDVGADLFRQIAAAEDDYDLNVRRAILDSRFGAAVTDAEIATLVHVAARRGMDSIGIMAGGSIARQVSIDRIEGFLDALALPDIARHRGSDEISHAAFAALARLLKGRPEAITPRSLHRWLRSLGYRPLFDEEKATAAKVRMMIRDRAGFQRAYLQLFIENVEPDNIWGRLSDAVFDSSIGMDANAQLVMDVAALSNDDPQQGPQALWFAARLATMAMPLPDTDFEHLLALTKRPGDYNKSRHHLTQCSLSQVINQRAHESALTRRQLRERADRITRVQENLAGIADGSAVHVLWLLSGIVFGHADNKKESSSPGDRLKDALGEELALKTEEALQRFLFEAKLPTPEETAEQALENKTLYLTTAVAACVELYWRSDAVQRQAERFVAVFSPERLASIFIGHMQGGSIFDDLEQDEERESLDESLARAHPEAVADALTRFMEPLLAANTNHIQGSYALANAPGYHRVAGIIAPRLLRSYPRPPAPILTDLVLATLFSDATADFETVIDGALSLVEMPQAHRAIWSAAGFLLNPDKYEAKLEPMLRDPTDGRNNAQSAISIISPDRRRQSGAPLSQDTALLTRIAGLFGKIFPNPALSSFSSRSRSGSEVHDFVKSCIVRVAGDYGDDAGAALGLLSSDPDLESYRADTLHATESRSRVVRERAFKHSAPAAVAAALGNGAPANIDDLAALISAHLEEMSGDYQNGDTDGWRKFWNTDSYGRALPGGHKGEEECRDRMLDDLRSRLKTLAIISLPELHMADDKEVDIAALAGAMKLPVEIKLETHRHLWTAPAAQLRRLYSIDPSAQGRGIYAVLWLGGQQFDRSIARPPGGMKTPTSAAELLECLTEIYANAALLQFVVLDGTPKKIADGKVA